MKIDFKDLKLRLFSVRVAARPTNEDSDAQLLAAVVMALAAVCDADLSTREFRTIIGLLRARFGLSENEALKFLAAAVKELYEHEVTLEDVRVVLNQSGFSTDKRALLLMSLQVLAADGPRGNDELVFLSQLIEHLGLGDADIDDAFSRYFAERPAVMPHQSGIG